MTKQCMMSKKLIGSTERKDEISLPARVRKNRFSITQLAYTRLAAGKPSEHPRKAARKPAQLSVSSLCAFCSKVKVFTI